MGGNWGQNSRTGGEAREKWGGQRGPGGVSPWRVVPGKKVGCARDRALSPEVFPGKKRGWLYNRALLPIVLALSCGLIFPCSHPRFSFFPVNGRPYWL